MKRLAIGVIAAYTMVWTATPVYANDSPTPAFVVSRDIPAPKFERLSGISIVKARTYTAQDRLSAIELRDLLSQVGFHGEALRQAWGTAMKESTGRPMAHNQNSNTGDNSYGLFQINMIGSIGPARLKQFDLEKNEDLFNPLTNAKIAYIMSNGGKNWSAWNGLTESTLKWMKEFPK